MRQAALWSVMLICAVVCQADVVLCDFEDLTAWEVQAKPAVFEASPDAHEGEASIQVTMPGRVIATVAANYPPADWDAYDGASFWAKGDGSDQWGCLALAGAGSNGGYSYCHFFPLKSTEWTKYTVAWRDWIPEGPQKIIGTPGSLPPSGIQTLRLGTRWTITHNNARIPEHRYWGDDVRLVEDLPQAEEAPTPLALDVVIGKLRRREPLHIVCMGDSLTAGTGLRNRDAERYATQLQAQLRAKLGYDEIIAESRAVGGAKLIDARAWVNRDFQGDAPDLITTLYGYNDKSGRWTAGQFAANLEDYLDRLATVTSGEAALVPLTTVPGCGPRYTMLDDFAQAVRGVCHERALEYIDVQKALKSVGREGILPLMGDMAHPNVDGHAVIATTIADFLVARVQTGQ